MSMARPRRRGKHVPHWLSALVILAVLATVVFFYNRLWKPKMGLEMTPKLKDQLERWKAEYKRIGGPPGRRAEMAASQAGAKGPAGQAPQQAGTAGAQGTQQPQPSAGR